MYYDHKLIKKNALEFYKKNSSYSILVVFLYTVITGVAQLFYSIPQSISSYNQSYNDLSSGSYIDMLYKGYMDISWTPGMAIGYSIYMFLSLFVLMIVMMGVNGWNKAGKPVNRLYI
jgi:hypothetical protein